MTCPSLQRRRQEATALAGDSSSAALQPVDPPVEQVPAGTERDKGGEGVLAAVVDRVRRDDTLGQFFRFVLVGSASTALYALLFIALEPAGYLAAHVVGTAASTVLANELHRRLTFRAEERVGWLAAQVEAGGVSLFGLVATSVALGWLDATAADAHPALQITLVAAVTGFIGLIRFIALRWIFRPTKGAGAQ